MKITNPGDLTPEYRALQFERAPVFTMILHNLHEAGFTVMFQCDDCSDLHLLTDEVAERFLQEAFAAEAATTSPAHGTVQ
jgi:hypothetical protein